MKKFVLTVLPLLLCLMFASCGSGSSNSSYNDSNYSADPSEIYSSWQECVSVDIQNISRGMMSGPGVVVRNICSHEIKHVRVVLYYGMNRERFAVNFYDLKPGNEDSRPCQISPSDVVDYDVEVKF